MRTDTQLDYAIFQLTPTRTRCELHIVAKGVTYKLASGLLNPFISHLKAAEEQLAKGGYSLRLEPSEPSRASWFTKGTMERFVRFVSTPEVLERVSSVEVELLELEETTRQQTAEINDTSGSGQVDMSLKVATSPLTPGGKSSGTAALDKGTKGYSDVVESGSEESSKQRLLRALDARHTMLQKEQGMAFARALAAGFNLENMDDLVLFAECFGADRLREACSKFVALCKKRQESGLGLEELELMAADTVQADMLYMGAVGGNAVGLVWPHLQGNGQELPPSPGAPNEGNLAVSEDSAEKTREEPMQVGPSSMLAGGDGDSLAAAVKRHPMMAAWQGQPHNQFLPGVPPYPPIHPSMVSHFDPSFGFTGPIQPGQMGLAYPHYLGGSYVPPPYGDANGWQSVPPMPPKYWPGNQVSDPKDGSHHRCLHDQSVSTSSSREKDMRESNKFDGDNIQDNEEDYANEILSDLSERPSGQPAARKSSPMRKVQISRNGGSKHSGMVVIRNINYIAPKGKQQDNQDDENSEESDSWSDDSEEGEILESGIENLRTSIEDAVEAVEGKHRMTQDGKRKLSKKSKKKVSSKQFGHHRDDAEVDEEDSKKHTIEQKDYVWTINRRDSGAEEILKVFPEEGLVSGNGMFVQGSFDPAPESQRAEKRGLVDAEIRSLPEEAVFLSGNNGNRATESQLVDMFKQEQHVKSKQMPIVDDSCMILGGGSSVIGRGNAILGPDYDFNIKGGVDPQAAKPVSDDSFVLLDRSAGREASNEHWSMPLNLQTEMPLDKSHDPADVPKSFEPDDLFMVPDRDEDAHMRMRNSLLDYNMQMLAADFMEAEKQGEGNDAAEGVDKADTQDQEVPEKLAESIPVTVSDKNTKSKATKEMLERRRLFGGGRIGRPNPLAEAQLRAEKLRLYKAGLQKSKQEREEEDRKRIEDLRTQRQQRIAARSNSGGTSQFSPSSIRGAKTPPPIGSKSSPKAPNPLSSSVSLERFTNGSRAARNIPDSTKPSESSVTRSVASLAEQHRESKKLASVVRASTGSQVLSPSIKGERRMEVNTHGKSNGRVEDKSPRAKIGHTDDKIARSRNGLAEERVGSSESGRIDEKIGLTESGHTDGLSESGRISEKSLPITARAIKRVVAQDGSALHVKSPRSPTSDTVVSRRTLTVRSERVDELASQVKSSKSPSMDNKVLKKASTVPFKPAAQKKVNSAPQATTVKKAITEGANLPSSLKPDPQAEKSESLVNVFGAKDLSSIDAQNSLLNGNGNKHVPHAPMATQTDNLGIVKAVHENVLSTPSPVVTLVEESQMGVSQTGSSLEMGSIAKSDGRQETVEASCPVDEDSENSGEMYSNDINCASAEMDICTSEGHLTGEYSPPFVQPSEYPMSLFVNPPIISPTTEEGPAMESSPTEVASTRSRKKWGDSKPKGFKRLLLLGRKSGRSSTHHAVDVPSEGEEEESHSSNGKNFGVKLYDDLDTCTNQAAGSLAMQGDFGSLNSVSKGSRSIFSLPAFRGNKSTVKAL